MLEKGNGTKFAQANECFKSQDYEKAICLYREAINQDSEGASEIYSQNLILALHKLGRKKAATKEAYKALAKSPKNKAIESLLEHSNKKRIVDAKGQGPALSIIVPVYNSGQYLEQCLNSISNQFYQDYELIIVNDGSTDNSAAIINEYKKNNSRIKVINNEIPSGNPGRPRNQALDVAKGTYIGFVDSDDWVEPDFFDRLMEKALAEASDIVISGGFINQKKNFRAEYREYVSSGFGDTDSPLCKYHESFMIWDKVFSSNLLNAFNIRLGETKAAVDVPFILKSYYLAHKVSVCPDLLGYNYRRESDSSVTVNYRKSSDCNFEIEAFDSVTDWGEQFDFSKSYKDIVAFRKVRSYIYTLSVIDPAMFDAFYKKVKESFKKIDRKVISKLSSDTGKTQAIKRFDTVLKETAQVYKTKYRPDLSGGKVAADKQKLPVTERQSFHLEGQKNGILFFPDWSKRNPYQKLLYSSIAKNYGVRIKGYEKHLFTEELLESSRGEFDYIHLHWLHIFMDFSRDDGADEFFEKLECAKSLGYKIVYTAHNIISHDSEHEERELDFRQKAVAKFDYILVHGQFAKERVINEFGVDSEKVFVVPHGSYEGYYPNYIQQDIARKKFSITTSDFVYLFFGNIKGYKGVDALLDAYSSIRKRHSNTKLIIAGRIFEEQAGEMITEYAKKDSSVIFRPGFIEEEEAQYFFNAANIVVLPYRRILTSGAAILSFSFHKPVIAPRSGLLPEIVKEGKQGYLFQTFEEMEQQMEDALQSTDNLFCFESSNKELRWPFITSGQPFSSMFTPYGQKPETIEGEKKAKYALLRIVGNDLPIRHDPNQTLTNLEFTLKNESGFDDCIKVWVLNRIIDSEKKQSIIDLLKKYEKQHIDIPYIASEMVKTPFAFDALPIDHYKLTREFTKLSRRNKKIVDAVTLKYKNMYLMNNNGARNTALEAGRELAKWVFPWDGNCFITDEAWESIVDGLNNRDDLQYHIVPMDRVLSNEDLLKDGYEPRPFEEPQMIFRDDAELKFNNERMYGFKPKVDLLKKLGVPGKWDEWTNLYPWKKHVVEHDRNAYNYAWSGWTARLFSGNKEQELSADDRSLSREQGIVQFICEQEVAELFKDFDKNKPAFFNQSLIDELKVSQEIAKEKKLDGLLKLLGANAKTFKDSPIYSVTTKTTLPPSENIKDYWHPAPYYWPNPDTESGLPYIRKDGQRVPGTRMYEPESAKYDRTSLQRLFDETTALALAGYVMDDLAYTQKAYELIHAWFIDPETSMNPHLAYAQVVMGKNDNKGSAVGIIETKDFYYFLDAIRLLKRSSLWTPSDEESINKWFSSFYEWLCTSEQGVKEQKAENNHGSAYDLQVYAIAAFLGKKEEMYDIIMRAASRLRSHVESDGSQPHELKRTTTAHYTAFNLHIWLNLNTLVENTSGLSLIEMTQNYSGEFKSALKLAAAWLMEHGTLMEWPFEQIDEFDKARYQHIYHCFSPRIPDLAKKYETSIASISEAKDVFFPHDGIAPYWKLSLSAQA
jgi:glycosyltransferase involved in cell wall biosynthesis